jgi:hypothetical protein
VLGGLIGNQIGEAYGVGGLGLVGTGAGGGGTARAPSASATWAPSARAEAAATGSATAAAPAVWVVAGPRRPDVIPGQANVRGSLDKEIIRRIIRRHINEVKYCYEQELTRQAGARRPRGGAVTIAADRPGGGLGAPELDHGQPRVRTAWSRRFVAGSSPSPSGGGIVIVTTRSTSRRPAAARRVAPRQPSEETMSRSV